MNELQRTIARHAAALMLAGLAVGGLAAFALSGQIPGDGKMLLAAHVTGTMGTFFLVAFGWTVPMLAFTPAGQMRLALAFIVANWANLAIGTAKAFLGVHGVGFQGELANDAVFVLLNLFVVIPTFAGSAAWLWGLRSKGAA